MACYASPSSDPHVFPNGVRSPPAGVSQRPVFIKPQDGQVKQDCDINAAKRWLAEHAGRYTTGNDTLLGDDLYAHQPLCRQVLLIGFHFLFTSASPRPIRI
jgi:hypothetical protein